MSAGPARQVMPGAFKIDDTDRPHAFVRRYSFATLVTGSDQPFATHLPLLLDETRGGRTALSSDTSPGQTPIGSWITPALAASRSSTGLMPTSRRRGIAAERPRRRPGIMRPCTRRGGCRSSRSRTRLRRDRGIGSGGGRVDHSRKVRPGAAWNQNLTPFNSDGGGGSVWPRPEAQGSGAEVQGWFAMSWRRGSKGSHCRLNNWHQ